MSASNNINFTPELLEKILQAVKAPYVDPAQAELKHKMRMNTRAIIKQKHDNEVARQQACTHTRRENGSSTFARVYLGKSQYMICLRCEHTIFPTVPEDRALWIEHNQLVSV